MSERRDRVADNRVRLRKEISAARESREECPANFSSAAFELLVYGKICPRFQQAVGETLSMVGLLVALGSPITNSRLPSKPHRSRDRIQPRASQSGQNLALTLPANRTTIRRSNLRARRDQHPRACKKFRRSRDTSDTSRRRSCRKNFSDRAARTSGCISGKRVRSSEWKFFRDCRGPAKFRCRA